MFDIDQSENIIVGGRSNDTAVLGLGSIPSNTMPVFIFYEATTLNQRWMKRIISTTFIKTFNVKFRPDGNKIFSILFGSPTLAIIGFSSLDGNV